MLIVEYEEIELDACPDCRGLWFDAQELRALFERAGVPEQFHDLESQLGRLPQAAARRRCPRCRGRLVPVQAPSSQGSLVLDECPRGDGLWFDQGELECLLRGLLGDERGPLEQVRVYLGRFLGPDRSGDGGEN
jgi:uncharacterized protein